MISLLRSKRTPAPTMTLEGLLGPNGRLDQAERVLVDNPDALCVTRDGHLLFSSGTRIMSLDKWGSEPAVWATLDARITALCSSAGGLIGVGLAGGRLVVLDQSGASVAGWHLAAGQLASVVDCAFRTEDELLLVDCGYGADVNVLAQGSWDDDARGRLVSLRSSGETTVIGVGLHCPMGVCLDDGGKVLIALLERAAIVDGAGNVRQSGYPGYLGRLRRTSSGFALACLSRRDPLIEFLKSEPDFVAQMKTNITPNQWIAPRANPEFSHDFPIELGATRLFGEVKPWAPSFSYGLLIELDATLMPVGSSQSRANGSRHAICDVVEWAGSLVTVSKASGEILKLGARP